MAVGEDVSWQDVVAIDEAALRPVVDAAVGRTSDSLGSWSEEIVTGGGGRSPGIRRFTGTGRSASGEVHWSVVLKCLARPNGGDEPDSWNSWRREADAYESGFLDALPGGAVAPRCFAVEEFAPGLVGLWLEDLGRPDGWPSRTRRGDDVPAGSRRGDRRTLGNAKSPIRCALGAATGHLPHGCASPQPVPTGRARR